jgi:hypothetical protein
LDALAVLGPGPGLAGMLPWGQNCFLYRRIKLAEIGAFSKAKKRHFSGLEAHRQIGILWSAEPCVRRSGRLATLNCPPISVGPTFAGAKALTPITVSRCTSLYLDASVYDGWHLHNRASHFRISN